MYFDKKISLEKNYIRKNLTLYSPSIPVNNFSLILAGSVCMGPKRVDLLGTWTNINLPLQMADMNWGWKLGHAQKSEGDVRAVKHGASSADTLVVACRPPWTLRQPVYPLKTSQVSQKCYVGSFGLESETWRHQLLGNASTSPWQSITDQQYQKTIHLSFRHLLVCRTKRNTKKLFLSICEEAWVLMFF